MLFELDENLRGARGRVIRGNNATEAGMACCDAPSVGKGDGRFQDAPREKFRRRKRGWVSLELRLKRRKSMLNKLKLTVSKSLKPRTNGSTKEKNIWPIETF